MQGSSGSVLNLYQRLSLGPACLRLRSVRFRKPEGHVYSDSYRNSVVLIDQSAELGNANYLTVSAVQGWLGFRGLERQPTMWALLVVMADVLP